MKKNDVKNDSRKDNNLMVKIATFIVDKRRAFYLIFALALVLCVISIPKVQVNNDISSYLPEETETRRGLTLMDDEFITYDTEKIMVTTITTETAEKLKDKLEKVDEHNSGHFSLRRFVVICCLFTECGLFNKLIAQQYNLRKYHHYYNY